MQVAEALPLLASRGPSELPVLSVYLDMRPEATGGRPGYREGETVLKDRLREIEKTLLPRGPRLDSFRADAARIERYLAEEADRAAEGIAIFACHGDGLFEVVEAGAPFENQVTVGSLPDLFQLARMLDDHETAVVGVADTNTLRLFVVRRGLLDERKGPDEDTHSFRKRSMGGWNQARYQRHVQKHREDFAKEAAAALEELVLKEGAVRVVLAGDEVAIPLLEAALSREVRERLTGDALRIHIRAPRDAIAEEALPVLEQAEAEADMDLASALVSQVQHGYLAVADAASVRQALERGQVDVLVLSSRTAPEDLRAEFTRMAVNTGASVQVVDGHEGLDNLGGIGALLRYQLRRK